MKTILILSTHPWGRMMLSKMHFARELSEAGSRVFFVDPPRKEVERISYEQLQSEKNLTIIHLPENSWRVITREKVYPIYRQLEKKYVHAIKKISGNIDEVWCFNPHLIADLDLFEADKTLLFVYDLYQGKSLRIAAEKSDVIVSVAQNILDEFKSINRPKLLLQHGLSRAFERKTLPCRRKMNERIRIGYIGNLMRGAIDFSSFRQVIEQHPELEFHFWGPSRKKNNNVSLQNPSEETIDFDNFLRSRNNIELHGVKNPQQLAVQIQQMDGFIFIYDAKRDMNGASNSHKLMEYLSTGKAVISTFVSSYEEKDLLVMDEKGSSDFVSFFNIQIKKLDELNIPELQKKRIDFALDNTYRKQIERIRGFLTMSDE